MIADIGVKNSDNISAEQYTVDLVNHDNIYTERAFEELRKSGISVQKDTFLLMNQPNLTDSKLMDFYWQSFEDFMAGIFKNAEDVSVELMRNLIVQELSKYDVTKFTDQ
jgi:hypothetical protein